MLLAGRLSEIDRKGSCWRLRGGERAHTYATFPQKALKVFFGEYLVFFYYRG